jgi:hypothetical protein
MDVSVRTADAADGDCVHVCVSACVSVRA